MISHFFIDWPIFASVLSIVITLTGTIALRSLSIAQYPRVTPPGVLISINDPGANAQVVAETVARLSLAHPPNVAPAPHAARTATTGRPFCPSPPASPKGTDQPQPADPLHDSREQVEGTATSTSCKTLYLACDTTFAPILTNFSRSIVSVQPLIGFGSTSCRKKLARF